MIRQCNCPGRTRSRRTGRLRGRVFTAVAYGEKRNLTGQASMYLYQQVPQPWDAYVEYSGAFPPNVEGRST